MLGRVVDTEDFSVLMEMLQEVVQHGVWGGGHREVLNYDQCG